jgi:hypothetical protein
MVLILEFHILYLMEIWNKDTWEILMLHSVTLKEKVF